MSHLTLEERHQIQALLKQRMTLAAIARELGRHRSTILRELDRNSLPSLHPYIATRAHKMAHARRVAKGVAQRRIQGALRVLVESKLRGAWSPEQISGRLWLEHRVSLSHETIYQHVLRDTHECLGTLRYCLRFGGYKHHRFRKSHHAEHTEARTNHIENRPAAANHRREIGHWERDCVLGTRGSAALLTIVDRKSRYTRIRRVAKLDATTVANATIAALRPHREVTKTLTNDNGVEFKRDKELEARLNIPIFFCDPSSPWQRGSIENLNGLVRQFVPKGTDVEALHPSMPAALEETLNHRPRKVLGFRTPHEVFFDQQTELMNNHVMRFGLEFS